MVVVVVGQVAAQDKVYAGVDGCLSETALAKSVRPLPAAVRGKTLGASSDLVQAKEVGQVNKFSIEHAKGAFFFKINDTFSVLQDDGEHHHEGCTNTCSETRVSSFATRTRSRSHWRDKTRDPTRVPTIFSDENSSSRAITMTITRKPSMTVCGRQSSTLAIHSRVELA
eukprot:scaffold3396_cov176-Amphora_coffeaeformis.AAC.6